MDDIVKRLRDPEEERWQGRCSKALMRTAANEIERLREALTPFAADLDGWDDDTSDAMLIGDAPGDATSNLTVGDLRRARAALPPCTTMNVLR